MIEGLWYEPPDEWRPGDPLPWQPHTRHELEIAAESEIRRAELDLAGRLAAAGAARRSAAAAMGVALLLAIVYPALWAAGLILPWLVCWSGCMADAGLVCWVIVAMRGAGQPQAPGPGG